MQIKIVAIKKRSQASACDFYFEFNTGFIILKRFGESLTYVQEELEQQKVFPIENNPCSNKKNCCD